MTNDDRAARPLRAFAARVAVATLVVLGILAVVTVLWVGRIIVALLFLAIIIASTIRPSVEALKRRRVPRGIGVGVWLAAESSQGALLGALGSSTSRPVSGSGVVRTLRS